MTNKAPAEVALQLPPELPAVGVIILAAAPQLDVQKDGMVAVVAARSAFLSNLMAAYANCGRSLREWKCPPGDTWEVSAELAEEIAGHASGHAVLVNLGPSVNATGRRDVWWSQDVELALAKHLIKRKVAVSLVSVRTAITAKVAVYRGGRQLPGSGLIALIPCLLPRTA